MGLRISLQKFFSSIYTRAFIVFLISLNAALIGFETSPPIAEKYDKLFAMIDWGILIIFVIEIILKLFAFGRDFFRDWWNILDFLIVGVALVSSQATVFIFRFVRILRIFRLMSTVPELRFTLEAVFKALPSIGYTMVLLFLMFYIFAVICTWLFGQDFPDLFSDLGRSMFSLFQVMTLEGWSTEIAKPVMEKYPFSWALFILFIFMSTFVILNLLIAIIINAVQQMHEEEHQEEERDQKNFIHGETLTLENEIMALRKDVKALRELLEKKINEL